MGQRSQRAGIAALIGSLVLAVSATPAAAKDASFKIEVFAEQHSTWTRDSTIEQCSGFAHLFGSGSQSFSLTTKKPVKATAESFDSIVQFFFEIGPGLTENAVPVNVAIQRDGSAGVETIGESCAGGGGGEQPAPPDCGARSSAATVQFEYYSPTTYPDFETVPLGPVLSLNGPIGPSLGSLVDEMYANCPQLGPYGDDLLLTPLGSLPMKKLFGKKERFTLKVKDTSVFDSSGLHEEVQMSWRVSFKRR